MKRIRNEKVEIKKDNTAKRLRLPIGTIAAAAAVLAVYVGIYQSKLPISLFSDEKAYISQLDSDRIIIVNPKTFQVTGEIICPMTTPYRTGSTEQMVFTGELLYVACWSYQKRILKIDTHTDKVVSYRDIGIQPKSMVTDRNGKLWVMSDGGYEGNAIG